MTKSALLILIIIITTLTIYATGNITACGWHGWKYFFYSAIQARCI